MSHTNAMRVQRMEQARQAADPARSVVGLLAAGAGFAVASIYYNQPLLGVIAADLKAPPDAIGWIPTATQLGYAAGLLLLGPLADRYDRRRVILVKLALLMAALLSAAAAPSVWCLLAASIVIGISATAAQDFVPASAALAPAASRGRLVGTVMTGLLSGILLSRVASGIVAGQLGWRSVFVMAACAIFLIGLACLRLLPAFASNARLDYPGLLRSMGTLWRTHSALRRGALAQALLGVGFSAFWSTLAVMLHGDPFHMGSAAAGSFGLAGAAGALLAPVAGRIADRRGPLPVVRLGAGLCALSFAMLTVASFWPARAQLVALVVGAILFDLGIQGALIAHQTIIFGLDVDARSRLNAVLMTTLFIGMAIGSLLGSLLLAHLGWAGVTALALCASLAALAIQSRKAAS